MILRLEGREDADWPPAARPSATMICEWRCRGSEAEPLVVLSKQGPEGVRHLAWIKATSEA